ncbi:Protein of unknown function [Cotesia congregata]|nr:Protein of unknown function [Cotesia congregata]
MRTRVFRRSHLPPVKSNYGQDELYRSFINFFHGHEGLFRKVYVRDDDSVGKNQEQLESPDDTNHLEVNNEIETSVKISDENNMNNSTDNDKNKVVENPEAEKDAQKNPKRPSGSKPHLRSSKRIKKKLSDFIS